MTKGSHIAVLPKGHTRPQVIEAGDKARRAKVTEWRKAVEAAAAEARGDAPPLAGPVVASLTFMLPRPHTPANPWPVGDADKLTRLCLDALTRAAIYRDDAQVVRLTVTKTYGSPSGCRVRVWDLSEFNATIRQRKATA